MMNEIEFLRQLMHNADTSITMAQDRIAKAEAEIELIGSYKTIFYRRLVELNADTKS